MKRLSDALPRLSKPVGLQPDSSPQEVCAICKGAQWVKPSLESFDLVPCECSAEDIRLKRLKQLREHSAMGPRLHEFTFATWQRKHRRGTAPTGSADRAYDAAVQFAHSPQMRGWLVLWGPYGTGKTHLAAAIANEFLDAGLEVIFQTSIALLERIKSTFGDGADESTTTALDAIRNAPLLIIDDLGAEQGTSFTERTFFDILNHRHNYGLPLVVTTNLSPQEMPPRLRSRLCNRATCTVLEVNA